MENVVELFLFDRVTKQVLRWVASVYGHLQVRVLDQVFHCGDVADWREGDHVQENVGYENVHLLDETDWCKRAQLIWCRAPTRSYHLPTTMMALITTKYIKYKYTNSILNIDSARRPKLVSSSILDESMLTIDVSPNVRLFRIALDNMLRFLW